MSDMRKTIEIDLNAFTMDEIHFLLIKRVEMYKQSYNPKLYHETKYNLERAKQLESLAIQIRDNYNGIND